MYGHSRRLPTTEPYVGATLGSLPGGVRRRGGADVDVQRRSTVGFRALVVRIARTTYAQRFWILRELPHRGVGHPTSGRVRGRRGLTSRRRRAVYVPAPVRGRDRSELGLDLACGYRVTAIDRDVVL